MRTLGAAVLALAAAAVPALAATVTIDFDELADPNQPSTGRVGNVGYTDQNRFLYGHLASYLLLGDDGFTATTDFTADPGSYFTPLSVDLTAFSNLVRAPCPGCTPDELLALQDTCSVFGDCTGFQPYDAYDYLVLTGFRDGSVVATQGLGAALAGYAGTFGLSSAFAGISALRVMVTYRPPGGFPDAGNWAYACGTAFFSGCVGGSVDNLRVATYQPPGGPAPVPLPAGWVGLASAVGAAALLARRKARAA